MANRSYQRVNLVMVWAVGGLLGGLIWWGHRAYGPGSTPNSKLENSGLKGGSRPSTNTSTSVQTVSPRGYSALLDLALREPDSVRRSMTFGSLFREWFEKDREAALAYLRQMAQSNEAVQAMFFALPELAKTDSRRALILAGEMAVSHEGKFVYNTLFDQLAHGDLEDALNDLTIVTDAESRQRSLRALGTVWAERDIPSAVEWARTQSPGGDRNAALESVLSNLAVEDPWRSFDLAQDLLTGSAQERVLDRGLKQLIENGPQEAADLISRMAPGELQNKAATQVTRALTRAQPESAIAWIDSLPDPNLQRLARDNALDIWASGEPSAAANFVSNLRGDDQVAAASHLAEIWSAKDPPEAVRWAGGLQTEDARNAALVHVASGWARTDPAAAAQWAATLPASSPVRAESLEDALSYWALADPDAANRFRKKLHQQ